jgi:thioredoxin reductase (NADPH)
MSEEKQIEEVIILGTGPAGLSAALYAARADLRPLVITGVEIGGQAATTDRIENYPGFPEGVGGSELAELFQKNAERFGARMEYDTVTEVDLSARPFIVKTYSNLFFAKSIIVSTGARPNRLNIPGEDAFRGRGVSYCATCDGWFFKDKNVAVVGGGDSALEEALFLTRYAASVTIIHRRDELRASAILQKRAETHPKINIIWNSVVFEIFGREGVEKIKVKNVKDGSIAELPFDGLFIFIGHSPNTELYQGQIILDENNYIVVDKRMRTNVPGVFAAGEASDPIYRQVITSAGMGAAAAIEATRFLAEN